MKWKPRFRKNGNRCSGEFFGSTINPPAWYQIDLIIITCLFWGICSFFDEKRIRLVSITILILSLILQYSGLNYNIATILPYSVEVTVGRIVEVIPYAIIGLCLRDFIDHKGKTFSCLLLGIIGFISIMIIEIVPAGVGFGYSGISYIIAATVIVLFCERVCSYVSLPYISKKFIKIITSLSMGVYFIHTLIGKIYGILFKSFHDWSNVYRCIIVFVTSYVVCWMISKLPGKIPKTLVQ